MDTDRVRGDKQRKDGLRGRARKGHDEVDVARQCCAREDGLAGICGRCSMASGIVEHKWQTHQLYASASPQIWHEPFYNLYSAKGHIRFFQCPYRCVPGATSLAQS